MIILSSFTVCGEKMGPVSIGLYIVLMCGAYILFEILQMWFKIKIQGSTRAMLSRFVHGLHILKQYHTRGSAVVPNICTFQV